MVRWMDICDEHKEVPNVKKQKGSKTMNVFSIVSKPPPSLPPSLFLSPCRYEVSKLPKFEERFSRQGKTEGDVCVFNKEGKAWVRGFQTWCGCLCVCV
jgi:hypothetical protein